jgi:hypothetical protein
LRYQATWTAESYEAQPGQLPDDLAIDRGLEVEVELVRRLDPRPVRQLQPAPHAALIATAPRGFERLGQEALDGL